MNPYLLQLKTAALMLLMPYAMPSVIERESEQEVMSPYLQWMIIGTLVIFTLYGLRCLLSRRGTPIRKRALLTALVALVLTVRLALELARVGYVVLSEAFDLSEEGLYWDDDVLLPLFTFDAAHLSFFCGAVGVCQPETSASADYGLAGWRFLACARWFNCGCVLLVPIYQAEKCRSVCFMRCHVRCC